MLNYFYPISAYFNTKINKKRLEIVFFPDRLTVVNIIFRSSISWEQ